MRETSDGTLVARVLAGEREAFGILVTRHQDRMLAYVRYMGFGEAQAHDLVQDAFVRVLTNLHRFDPARPFGPWGAGAASRGARSCPAGAPAGQGSDGKAQ